MVKHTLKEEEVEEDEAVVEAQMRIHTQSIKQSDEVAVVEAASMTATVEAIEDTEEETTNRGRAVVITGIMISNITTMLMMIRILSRRAIAMSKIRRPKRPRTQMATRSSMPGNKNQLSRNNFQSIEDIVKAEEHSDSSAAEDSKKADLTEDEDVAVTYQKSNIKRRKRERVITSRDMTVLTSEQASSFRPFALGQ